MVELEKLTQRTLAGGVLLGAIAWGLLSLQIASMLGAPTTFFSILVATSIPVTLSVTLLIGAIGIYHYDLDDLALRIGGWTILGVVLFSIVLGGLVIYLQAKLSQRVSNSILIVNVAAGGAVMGFLIGFYDARNHRLLEDLREEYDRTVGLSQRLSVLARILRHDLRNQLTVIMGQADRLEAEDTSEDISKSAAAIQDASKELMSKSENIGQFSSILSDPHPDQTVLPIDLKETVEELVDKVEARHGSGSATIETDFEANAVVEASPFLPNALTELLENAIIHNDAQDPQVDIRVETVPGASEQIEICIADNGPGIHPDEIAIHDSDIETPLDHSTGVGLWLVRWVMAASGGDIQFDTETAEGTKVLIRLLKAE